MQSKEQLQKLAQAANIYQAPVALLICADHDASWKRGHDGKDVADIDASIVATHMMLQATALGLGSLWICAFKPDMVRQIAKLPPKVEPINLLVIGHPEGEQKSKDRHDQERKSLEEMTFNEMYR